MPLTASDIGQLANPFHAYIFGTSFWYAIRAFYRLTTPLTVIDWFRPPIQSDQIPTDLEIYTIWTDGFQLLSLALILLVIADAVPLPAKYTGASINNTNAAATLASKKPYARGVIAVTILHHVTTAWGAWQHWSRPTHYTIAMSIGVWVNVFLTVAGIVALTVGPLAEGEVVEQVAVGGRKKKA